MHFGNAILHPDLNTVYSIDRNFYLQLNKGDVEFIRQVMTTGSKHSLRLLLAIIDYFLRQSENKGAVVFNLFGKWRLIYELGLKLKLEVHNDPLSIMMTIMHELELRGIAIPLKIRIMFKNIISIYAMLQAAGAGRLEDYIKRLPVSSAAALPAAAPGTPSLLGIAPAFLLTPDFWSSLAQNIAGDPLSAVLIGVAVGAFLMPNVFSGRPSPPAAGQTSSPTAEAPQDLTPQIDELVGRIKEIGRASCRERV